MARVITADLDGVFGDTRPAWSAFLAHAAQRFNAIAPLDIAALSEDRVEAARQLDAWAASGVGDWRAQLTRFAEDHLPVYVRPDARVMGAARSLAAAGVELRVQSDAPQELVDVAAAPLGLGRLARSCEGGIQAPSVELPPDYVRTPAELDALLSDS
jgi:phosphoglycolate phosphatase-like HAD superfamily hydrolase